MVIPFWSGMGLARGARGGGKGKGRQIVPGVICVIKDSLPAAPRGEAESRY